MGDNSSPLLPTVNMPLTASDFDHVQYMADGQPKISGKTIGNFSYTVFLRSGPSDLLNATKSGQTFGLNNDVVAHSAWADSVTFDYEAAMAAGLMKWLATKMNKIVPDQDAEPYELGVYTKNEDGVWVKFCDFVFNRRREFSLHVTGWPVTEAMPRAALQFPLVWDLVVYVDIYGAMTVSTALPRAVGGVLHHLLEESVDDYTPTLTAQSGAQPTDKLDNPLERAPVKRFGQKYPWLNKPPRNVGGMTRVPEFMEPKTPQRKRTLPDSLLNAPKKKPRTRPPAFTIDELADD